MLMLKKASLLVALTAAALLVPTSLAFSTGRDRFDDPDLDPDRDLGRTLVGSWQCEGTGGLAGFRFLTTFNTGGTFTVSFSNKILSETHGVWVRTGRNTFVSTDKAFIYDDAGIADRVQTVQASYVIKNPTDLVIDIDAVVTSIADGSVVMAFPAVVSCKRLLIGSN
jgi:hypothetical protein